MTDPRLHAATAGFARTADRYDRGRPEYPARVIDRLAIVTGLGSDHDVLDVGAGTGKLTRWLVPRAAHVVAVEPIDEMRAVLSERLPDVDARQGMAQDLPVADNRFDLVTVGQAFHWFAEPAVVAELARVLHPGGHLALLWLVRDVEAPLQQDLSRLFAPYRGDVPRQAEGAWKQAFLTDRCFGPRRTETHPFEVTAGRADFVDRVLSISFVGALPDEEQRTVRAQTERIFDTHAQDGLVAMPYVAELHWMRLERSP